MNPTPLTYLDGETLMSTVLPPIRFVVDKLLPQGLHILAGAPKVGKSWLALWLCLCVAKGEPVWNFPTFRGSVLYLCLEDSYSRIQNRLLDITDDAPANLCFATMSEKLHSGLVEQIDDLRSIQPTLRVAGVLFNQWHCAPVVTDAMTTLREECPVPIFDTVIRRTDKVPESSWAGRAVQAWSPWCSAARDYRTWVAELMAKEGMRHEG